MSDQIFLNFWNVQLLLSVVVGTHGAFCPVFAKRLTISSDPRNGKESSTGHDNRKVESTT